MNQSSNLIFETTPETQRVLQVLAIKMKRTPSGVLSLALALLERVQGKKVILKQIDNNSQTEIDLTQLPSTSSNE
jgi:hypothetical protein